MQHYTFARDHSLSFDARGVLATMVYLPEFADGATAASLAETVSDPIGAALDPLTELMEAGYVTPDRNAKPTVYRTTSKARIPLDAESEADA